MRRAKIVATIGPASDSEQALESLITAGMNVARLNFSHGTHEQHARRVATIRSISKKLNTPVGILQDLQGPKIRVGKLDVPLQLICHTGRTSQDQQAAAAGRFPRAV
jgi:pyruvate kinase